MPLVLGGSSAVAAAYSIDNSCRFTRTDSEELHYTQVTPTDNNTWTMSCWFKRSSTAYETAPWGTWSDGSNQTKCRIMATTGTVQFFDYQSGGSTGQLNTNRIARDVAGWYHLVCVWDSDNGTAGDRMKMYINGVEQGSVGGYSTDTNPSSGQATIMNVSGRVVYIGRDYDGTYWDGYIAEAIFIDGTAYAASDFGEFNSASPTVWQPKDPSGLTFGNNGFWLDFKDSADLGNDVSGKSNDFTVANLTASDHSQDSPTNNFCTLNSLDSFYGNRNFSYGNNRIYFSGGGTQYAYASSTMAMSAGKWYWEIYLQAGITGTPPCYFGFAPVVANASNNYMEQRTAPYNTYSYAAQSPGNWQSGGEASTPASMGTATQGDYIMMALDLENNFAYVGVNGTWLNSGDPTSGATGTGAKTITAAANMVNGWFTPAVGLGSSHTPTYDMNFGNGSFGSTVLTGTTYPDDNDYGIFKYDVPTGYYAVCTKNLAEFGG